MPGKGVALGATTLLRNLLADPPPEATANSLAVSMRRLAQVVKLLPAEGHSHASHPAPGVDSSWRSGPPHTMAGLRQSARMLGRPDVPKGTCWTLRSWHERLMASGPQGPT